MHWRLSPESTAEISRFGSVDALAEMTLPLLQCRTVALSGGSTFARLYPLWTGLSPEIDDTSLFPVDERRVPFDSGDSNWGTCFRLFLAPLGLGSQRSHFAESGGAYERILRDHFGSLPPVFDVVFLGVGDDGHTASLFPGSDALNDRLSSVLETQSPKPPFPRVTIGPAVIAAARRVVLIIAGTQKEDITRRIRDADESLPVVQMLKLRTSSAIFLDGALSI